MAEERRELGNYAYAEDMRKVSKSGALDLLTLEYLAGAGACDDEERTRLEAFVGQRLAVGNGLALRGVQLLEMSGM